jgi:Delta3-Delta2-enoyl-CoA isomerase
MLAGEKVDVLDGVVLTRKDGGVAHLAIGSPPANTLNLTLWTSLLAALRLAESDSTISVLIITSSLDRPIFSAGNDISELHAPSTTRERFLDFWITSTTFLASLYVSPLYTVASIRGACPAGGCVIALCCDYRIVLSDGLSFGLNEAALGIPVPKYWARLMLIVGSGHRAEVERMLYTGTMVGADDALRLGLVDRTVRSQLNDVAHSYAVAMSAAFRMNRGGADAGRMQTKLAVRQEFGHDWAAYGSEEAQQSWTLLSSRSVSDQLGRILRRLGKTSRKEAKL